MKKVLVINSSSRILNSHSRNLTEIFVSHWKEIYIDPLITYRELGNAAVPHIDQNWIAAAFKPAATRSEEEIEALKASDNYISELRKADIIVLGAPMYNWSIPSPLKAYIDHILRPYETWKPNPGNIQNPYTGLLENKTLYLMLSRGSEGYEKNEVNEHMNFQSTYLKLVFNIMGISNIHVIPVNGASLDPEKFKRSVEAAYRDIMDLIEMDLV